MDRENRLLAMLPADVIEHIRPHLDPVHLEIGQVVAEDGLRLRHAYFPVEAVCSVLIYAEDGDSLEVGLVGSEGMISTATFLSDGVGVGEVIVQRPGLALRMPAEMLRQAFESAPALRALLLRYTQGFMTQVAQSCACNGLHPIGQRCARWLLMMGDRADTEEFDLSQALLARMLGVGRPTVSLATAELRNAGLVRFSRGRVAILDRSGLESSACACYGIITAELERLLHTLGAD
ncbi:MAG: Crp/Fnr family transcriptional regulator [Chloroflexota bacterium]